MTMTTRQRGRDPIVREDTPQEIADKAAKDAAFAAEAAALDATAYQRERLVDFHKELPIGDQLDMIWRVLRAAVAQQDTLLPPDEVVAYRAMTNRIDAIKARHPKPSEA